jgi:hypothetical protein
MESQSVGAWVHMPPSIWMETYNAAAVLKWEQYRSDDALWKKGNEFGGALEQFIGLADSSASNVLSFARAWGVLGLCEHGMPFTHQIGNGWSSLVDASGPSQQLIETRCYATGFEPVEVWKNHSRKLRSVLSIASNLHQDKPGKPEDWLVIEPWHDPHIQYWKSEAFPSTEFDEGCNSVVASQKHHLTHNVQLLLTQSGARPSFEWSADNAPCLGIVPVGLAAVLALQVAYALCRTTSIVNCTACGKLYVPKRKPQSGRGKYCSACGPTAPARDYARRRATGKANHTRSFRVVDEMKSYKGGGLTTAADRWSDRSQRRQ